MTREHRAIIERAWNKNCELKKPHSVRWVAKRIGLAPSTLHDELARGCAIPPKPRGSLPERFPSYSARTAQAVCEERKREHGPRGKVTTVINQHLTHYIRELRMSPETAAYHLANGYIESFIKTFKAECLDHLILTSEAQLRYVVREFLTYYNTERPHSGLDGRLVKPSTAVSNGEIKCFSRLGGLLKSYRRVAA